MTITPDTKNWTWVIERRCPECGFDASTFPREQISEIVRSNAASWSEVLRQPAVDARPSENTWSPLEYACHVRDVYRIFDERLRRMLTEDNPVYENWDQDQTAIAEAYNSQQPPVVAQELMAAGAAIADRFETVTGQDWSRPGRRTDGSSFTIETFARYFAHDWIHHLWDVRG